MRFNFGFPFFWGAPAVYQPPSTTVIEQVAAAPAPGYVWIAGHWSWNGQAWVWIAGQWQMPPQPSAIWSPGHWVQTPGGWIWADGTWVIPAGASASATLPPPPPAPPAPAGLPGSAEGGSASTAITVVPQPRTPAPQVAVTLVAQEPPTPIVEAIPLSPGADFVWISGSWTWQNRWVWTSGYYSHRPFGHADWVPGYWSHQHNGWAWERGHWR